MMTVPLAIGCLLGNPIAGALVNGDDFVSLQAFCGSVMLGGAFFFLAARIAKTGVRLTSKC